MDPQPDWSREFKSLLSSPIGKELIRELKVLHDSIIQDAEKAQAQEGAFGLLKQGAGVMLALDHLNSLSVVPRDEGSQD